MSDKIPEYMNMQGKRKIARQNVIVKKVKTHKTHVNIKKYMSQKSSAYMSDRMPEIMPDSMS